MYFKENYDQAPPSTHLSTPPLILSSDDNTFYNDEVYIEAVNGFTEASVSDRSINAIFQRPTNPEIKNFSLTLHTIIDKYIDDRDDYTPEDVETYRIDALADTEDIPALSQGDIYSVHPHIATLSYAGGISGITLTNTKLKNIKDDIESNIQVTLTPNTALYASDDDFQITYTER